MSAHAQSSLLRDLRISAGYGLKEFAREIGIRPSLLSAIENGRLAPRKFRGDICAIPLFCHAKGMKRLSGKQIKKLIKKVQTYSLS
jgi:transcriptional regulator with XRE-family HTH domain